MSAEPQPAGQDRTPGPEAPDVVLAVRGVSIRFGGVAALDDVSLDVRAGRICGLIGPNGAGKTTLFNCITRIYQPGAGTITWEGRDLLSLRPHRLAAAGIARTFQNLALFRGMTVLQNAMVGATCRAPVGLASGLAGWPPARRRQAELEARAYELLAQLDLTAVAHHPAAGLPFGTLKRVELARALMAQPRLLLLDEPAGGLTHGEVAELGELIVTLSRTLGFAALLVEHHMGLVLGISDDVVALDFGHKIFEGPPDRVRSDPAVVAAYLGRAA